MDRGAAKRRKAPVEPASSGDVGRKPRVTAELSDKENGRDNIKRQNLGGKTVEEMYQKKSQLEHILLRPDSYVGSTERQSQEHWVFDESSGKMTRQKLDYVPALYKIFDEILVNAADNLVRSPTQDTIHVEVDRKRGSMSVMNNGQGLPILMHKEHNCYVPELVFGQLLTSDNYDDNERKVTGGRNGYGAKLTNIFSTRFIVETADSKSRKLYKQIWEKNMTVRRDPQISSHAGEDFTKVTFFPDFSRFQMEGLEDDIVMLIRRRAYDVAASTHGRCKVFLNGKQLEVQSFEDYVNLYLTDDAFRRCQVLNDRWEIAVGLTDGSGFQQVSFVNSISTSRGGTHVNYIADQVVNAVLEKVSKQKGSGALSIKAQHVKNYFCLFVNCLIENPAFDSQTKETLTSKRERFGSTCQLPEDLCEAILESGIIDSLLEWSKAMGKSELAQHLNKSDLGMQKRIFGVPKLEDANRAGTKDSASCTLIITEGDSAKALAVAGLAVIGRDHYGVFPLRGKLRNVRDLTVKQMMENREIDQVMKILALDATKEYSDAKGLRYGSIMIMTDQDHDGSHIKGLFISFIQQWFPSLLRVPGFMKEFVTPIVKVTKGEETHTFFTLPEYAMWREENDNGRGWHSKYYKGLGTSTSKEAKDYFSDLGNHEIRFTYGGEHDDELIDMAFNSKRADERKAWISACEEGTFVDHSQPTLSYKDFIEKELVLFAKYDVERAVPSLVDGLKPGQRKVLFGCFKKKLHSDIKVAQLSGYVAENSAYHHGEASLQGTIIGMAQTFVGSNNINLLVPSGQFGTRLQGGRDHAAARYIFTRLSKATRCLFPEEDDAVLDYLNEEGTGIEPRWYCPVIPLVLVNGASGIGTGWSVDVPNYNPREVIANIRRYLRKEQMVPLVPWYRGFKGSVTPLHGIPGKFEACGVAMKRGRVRLEITELPVRRWTQDYKEWIVEQLPQPGSEKRATVTELREYHSENSVHFVLSMTPDKLADAERRGFEKVFHLRSSLATTNMWLFDPSGKIKKYDSPEEILEEFAPVRLKVYESRKAHIIERLQRELAVVSNKLRFVELVISDRLNVEKRKTSELCAEMRSLGLQTMREIRGNGTPPEDEAGADGYRYLLSMKLWSLTDDKVQALNKLHEERSAALEELRGTSLETLWERDLARLEQALDAIDAEDAKEAEAAAKMAAKNMGDENLLVNKQCVIVLSSNFTVKRVRTSEWKARQRGAKIAGKSLIDKKAKRKANCRATPEADEKSMETEEADAEAEDEEEDDEEALAGVYCCHDFDALLVFSEHGHVCMLQALDVPLAKKMSAQGTSLKEFLPEFEGHRITALATVSHVALRDQNDEFVVLVSAKGMAKKVSLDKFRGLKPGKSIQAMTLVPGDELRWALRASVHSALVIATTEGFLLRCSLGQDWTPSSAKAPGRLAIRPVSGDKIASCSISKMSPEEIAAGIARRKKAAAARAATSAGAAGTGGEDKAVASVPMEDDAGEEEADGDESEEDDAEEKKGEENCVAGSAEPDAGRPPCTDKSDEIVKDEMDEVAEGPEGAAEEAKLAAGTAVSGQCALVVTESGMGLQMPLACKRIGLARRGGRGKLVIKLAGDDRVVGVCVTAGPSKAPQPQKQRPAWMFYRDSLGDSDAVEPAPGASGDEVVLEAVHAEANGFSKMLDIQERFKALPEEEQRPFQEQAEKDKERYLQELDAYKREGTEEVLLGTTGGLAVRIAVSSMAVMTKAYRGKVVAKLKGSDKICAVSLLSSMDDDPDEVAAANSDMPPVAKATATRRACRAKVASIEVAPHGLGGGSSSSTTAATAATTTIGDSTSGSGASKSATLPSLPARGELTPKPPKDTFDVEMAGSSVHPIPKSALISPKRDDPTCRIRLVRRIHGKTRQSVVAAAAPYLGKRGRLSILSPRPRVSTPGRRLTLTPRIPVPTIQKPKTTLLCPPRQIVTKTIDLAAWAARRSSV